MLIESWPTIHYVVCITMVRISGRSDLDILGCWSSCGLFSLYYQGLSFYGMLRLMVILISWQLVETFYLYTRLMHTCIRHIQCRNRKIYNHNPNL